MFWESRIDLLLHLLLGEINASELDVFNYVEHLY
jgi:hypothetical protein